jgi:hypothetical protein
MYDIAGTTVVNLVIYYEVDNQKHVLEVRSTCKYSVPIEI